jgi:hypothetical protein
MRDEVDDRPDRPRPRADRGVIGLIPAIIAVLVGAAAAAVTIVAVSANKSNTKDPDVYLGINDVNATRDAHGRPHVHIKYRVAVSGERPAFFTPEARVECYVLEAGQRGRAFIGETSIFVAESRSRDGALTITPAESDSDIQGPVRVRCDVSRSGRTYFAKTVTVDVPGPNDGSAKDVADPTQYAGVYQVTFKRVSGIPLNCDPPTRKRTFTVKALSSSTFSLELGGPGSESIGISSFDATLTKTAQFSGQVYLNPTDGDWKGLLTGTFSKSGATATVRGRFDRDDGHCAFEFEGSTSASSSAGGVAISLEEIPGVDGCTAELSTTHIKAGPVTFTVTNNTFGFAQIFVYDAEHNLAANNKKDIPARGGTGTMSATLVTGTYDVACDGPGAEDKTVQLVVD